MRFLLPALVLYSAVSAGPTVARSVQVDDTLIRIKAKVALLTSPEVRIGDLAVEAEDAVVTLRGTVRNTIEKTRAEEVASAVPGVAAVDNQLQIVRNLPRQLLRASDDEIASGLRQAFADDRMISQSQINVASVERGVVRLGGQTRSLATHLRAIELAHGALGVRRVATDVQIKLETKAQ